MRLLMGGRRPTALAGWGVIGMRGTSDHAIVLGASLAGLLTARVLAEYYKQVTVVERDALPPAGQHRKGVPHGRHLHGLHPRGREILDELFPDFTAEMTAAGAVCCDVFADARWQLSGHQLKQRHADLPALLASRPSWRATCASASSACRMSACSRATPSPA